MSFVNSVLFTAEKTTISDAKNRIPSLQVEVNAYKISVDKYFHDVYTKHLLEPKRHVQLEKVHLLLHEVNNMQNQVEEIIARNFPAIDNELADLRDNVVAAHFSIQQINVLIKIHESFKKTEKALAIKNFIQAVQELSNLTEHVRSVSNTSQLSCVQQLLNQTYTINDEVSSTLADIVKKAILLERSTQENIVISTITVAEPRDSLLDVFKACYILSVNGNYLDSIARFLWTEILSPIICHKSTLDLSSTYIKITYNPNCLARDFYKDTFDKLIQLFEHVNNLIDYRLDDNCTVMQCIGAYIHEDLSELLIKECLDNTIPVTPESLAQYGQVIADTEVFQKRLVELNVLCVGASAIIDHVNNVDLHFINKKCDRYMTDALIIMKEDLHDIVEVGGESGAYADFAKCCVSKSVIKLIELGEKILDWATKSSEISAERLFDTVQKIFHKYHVDIKLSHSALLETIPQQVAIFYNNCMYLAYVIAELNAKYATRLQNDIKSVDFEQLSHICKMLIDTGTNSFDYCVEEQIKLAAETLKKAELEALKTNANLNLETMEKAIRQCLRQQELLKTVWQKILNTTHYNAALGAILNTCCNYIILAVLSAEDINSTNAEYLVDVLKLMLTRGPKLFQPNTNLSEIVPRWNKLSGLVFILHASMIDISEKWVNRSKSDLFADFKATEIRLLIKAIFQNSDRRASVLTKIQD